MGIGSWWRLLPGINHIISKTIVKSSCVGPRPRLIDPLPSALTTKSRSVMITGIRMVQSIRKQDSLRTFLQDGPTKLGFHFIWSDFPTKPLEFSLFLVYLEFIQHDIRSTAIWSHSWISSITVHCFGWTSEKPIKNWSAFEWILLISHHLSSFINNQKAHHKKASFLNI
jgi:hypothetical protein